MDAAKRKMTLKSAREHVLVCFDCMTWITWYAFLWRSCMERAAVV